MKQLKAEGLNDLSLDEVTSATIHGLRPASIREIRSLGLEDPDFDDLLQARIHGSTPLMCPILRKPDLLI